MAGPLGSLTRRWRAVLGGGIRVLQRLVPRQIVVIGLIFVGGVELPRRGGITRHTAVWKTLEPTLQGAPERSTAEATRSGLASPLQPLEATSQFPVLNTYLGHSKG